MKIEENISAKKFSTLKIGGTIRYHATATNIEEIKTAISFAEEKQVPLVLVGGGSNSIWKEGEHNILALSIDIKDIQNISSDDDQVVFKVGAGISWDSLVENTVKDSLWGIECLSGIPGLVGASPVQNIGAYGQEIKDVLVSVDVYDLQDKKEKTISKEDCNFSYRNSIFKSEAAGRYIILYITIKLSKINKSSNFYESLQKYFNDTGIAKPTLSDIRNGVLNIRSTKLPDPSKIPNCGSFFENPIITKEIADLLKDKYPDIKIFNTERIGFVKIPAGWLIEQAGFRGKDFENIGIYKNNALVLVNNGNATFDELMITKEQIVSKVREMFNVELEMEPNVR